jgi:hypothetical protein
MIFVWVSLALVFVILLVVGFYVMSRPVETMTFENPQEERLTRKVVQTLGCSLDQALSAVRKEMEFSPDQPDEILLKRAIYHCRRELPDKACPIYTERNRG